MVEAFRGNIVCPNKHVRAVVAVHALSRFCLRSGRLCLYFACPFLVPVFSFSLFLFSLLCFFFWRLSGVCLFLRPLLGAMSGQSTDPINQSIKLNLSLSSRSLCDVDASRLSVAEGPFGRYCMFLVPNVEG